MVDNLEALNSQRLISRAWKEPCPLGRACEGYGDRWEGYYPCTHCGGSGTRWRFSWRWVGYLWSNLHAALNLHRAFQEGYSAGVTDALAR